MKKKRKLQLNNSGTTLVEMLVSFVLLSLFMVAAMRIISYTVTVYYEAKATANGMEVCNLVTNKIIGELESAYEGRKLDYTSVDWTEKEIIYFSGDKPAASNMLIASDGKSIIFTDKFMNQVCIYVNEQGLLALHYYPIIYGDKDPSNRYSADWTFDVGAYLGYTISELRFSQAKYNTDGTINPDYGDNIIRIDLTVHSGKFGDYSMTQFVDCYNFRENGNILLTDFSYGGYTEENN